MLSTSTKEIQPSLFIAHGNPNLLITPCEYRTFLTNIPTLIKKPEAIVIFTAHWESTVQRISNVTQYTTIHDFTNFPKEMYELTYNAPGNQELAKEIYDIFTKNGVESELDDTRGIDHGAWAILKIMYPEPDIPIVQLSINPEASAEEAYNIGKLLEPLRERGIAIIGSGNTVHNVAKIRVPLLEGENPDYATEFDDWIEKTINEWNTEDLFAYNKKGPYAFKAAPTSDHFIPLLYALGAADKSRKPKTLHRSNGTPDLSYFTLRFD